MGMIAGSLDKRVILQQPQVARNEFGEPVETWVLVAVVSAAKLNLPGAERTRAAETAGSAPLRFQIRSDPQWAQIDTTWRVLFADRGDPRLDWPAYNIEDVQTIGRHEGFDIRATARAEGA